MKQQKANNAKTIWGRRQRKAARRRTLCLAASISTLLLASCTSTIHWDQDEAFDLVIANGRVMDPASGLDAIRNIGIRDGIVEEITIKGISGTRSIDAQGLVVAPGFVDLHAHDHSNTTYRLHAQDGVTTALELELGVYPVGQWYERRLAKSAINFGAAASHGLIRAIAFDAVKSELLVGETHLDYPRVNMTNMWFQNKADAAKIQQMTDVINSEIEDGAIGIGFHLAATPGADHQEMLHFYGLASKLNAPSFVHFRSVGQVSPSEGALELVDAAQKTDARIHMVHINSSGLWETNEVLEILQSAQGDGLNITGEAYPYTGAGSAMNDPRTTPGGLAAFGIGFGDLELVETGERLTEETFKKYKKTKPTAELIAHVMKQADVDSAIEHDLVMVASDGGRFQNGKGHPRGSGTFAKIFKRYMRERGTIGLMEAINKVTYMPAQVISYYVPEMKGRGQIVEGGPADITVFDADRIGDRSTYQQPVEPSEGIAYVIVNGTLVVDRYEFVEDAKPGQPLYGAGRAVR